MVQLRETTTGISDTQGERHDGHHRSLKSQVGSRRSSFISPVSVPANIQFRLNRFSGLWKALSALLKTQTNQFKYFYVNVKQAIWEVKPVLKNRQLPWHNGKDPVRKW